MTCWRSCPRIRLRRRHPIIHIHLRETYRLSLLYTNETLPELSASSFFSAHLSPLLVRLLVFQRCKSVVVSATRSLRLLLAYLEEAAKRKRAAGIMVHSHCKNKLPAGVAGSAGYSVTIRVQTCNKNTDIALRSGDTVERLRQVSCHKVCGVSFCRQMLPSKNVLCMSVGRCVCPTSFCVFILEMVIWCCLCSSVLDSGCVRRSSTDSNHLPWFVQ